MNSCLLAIGIGIPDDESSLPRVAYSSLNEWDIVICHEARFRSWLRRDGRRLVRAKWCVKIVEVNAGVVRARTWHDAMADATVRAMEALLAPGEWLALYPTSERAIRRSS